MKKKVLAWMAPMVIVAAGTGCSSEVGVPLRDAAISASATFVEATMLEILNNLFNRPEQPEG